MIIVLIFVVILAFSYINLRQKSKKIAKEQQQVESQIKKQEEKKKELKKKKEYISNAKRLLMEKNQMTEEEAYRHIQKCSMDSGTNMVETAQMLLMLMYDEIWFIVCTVAIP